jgi:hypothetical protein
VVNMNLQNPPPFPGSEPLPPPGLASQIFVALVFLGFIVVMAIRFAPPVWTRIVRIVKACALRFRRRQGS